MAKGYLIVEIEITDPETYERYRATGNPILVQYGGRVIAGGGTTESLEGGWAPGSLFVVEFESYAKAHAFYFSREYQKALVLRLDSSKSKAVLLEGAAI